MGHLPLGPHVEPVFTIRVVDANTSTWTSLDAAIRDWDASTVLNVVEEPGAEDKRCRAVSGKVKSCNGKYGQNGWLGVAQIWLTGGYILAGHREDERHVLRDAAVHDPTKRQHVMCQEIGHDWGLAIRTSPVRI